MHARSVERGVAIQGDAAVQWLVDRGFDVLARRPSLQLYGDEVAHLGFVLRRTWTSGFSVLLPPTAAPSGQFLAAFMIDGHATINRKGGGLSPFTAGQLLVRDRREALSLASSEPMAFIHIESHWDRLLDVGHVGSEPIDVANGFAQIFTTLTTVVLNSSASPEDGGFGHLRRAIESTLSAALIQNTTAPEWSSTSAAQRRLFRRAADFIAARADDPTLTLNDIVQELAVSKTYLQRAFRAANTTPMRYLQRVRAANARALISSHRTTGRAELERIAHQAGFNSIETMRSVIARELPL